MIEVT